MEQTFIEIEGIQVDSDILGYLILGGIIKANEDMKTPCLKSRRKAFLKSCIESATELVHRIEEISTPKI